MLGTAMSQWMYLSTWYLTKGYQPERTTDSSHQSVVPSQVFKVADGHVMVTCMTHQFWVNLCEALGLAELVDDPRFVDFQARRENRDRLIPILSEAFQRHTRTEISTMLEGRVPMEVIRTFAEGMEEFRAKHPDAVLTVDHPEFGSVQMVGSPVRSGAWTTRPRRGPRWGENTRSVLRDVGFSDEAIDSLVEQKVVRCG
jgi:crotonobetainyl-CoA:carnitine CoA-transferase CaiB-like acyl-CoA transferase